MEERDIRRQSREKTLSVTEAMGWKREKKERTGGGQERSKEARRARSWRWLARTLKKTVKTDLGLWTAAKDALTRMTKRRKKSKEAAQRMRAFYQREGHLEHSNWELRVRPSSHSAHSLPR